MKHIFFAYSLLLLIISCSDKKETVIHGNIPNLPDGKIYLYKNTSPNRIDSTTTKNGVFTIKHKWENNNEIIYLGLDHIDQNNVTRAFNFPTNSKFRGDPINSPDFLSDSIINIEGKIEDFIPKGFKLPKDYKLITTSRISAGKQTEASYNIDADLFLTINDKTINTIKEKLVKYPYSYHLLYEISKNKNSFSALQVKDFLKSFKGEITNSGSYKKLYIYNEKRFNAKNITLPLIEDPKGAKKEIIDKTYDKHLIVFWASWCGPCRQEIPILKNIYKKYGSDIEFVSISIDDDKSAWQKALTQENMIWKQLAIKNTNPDYEKLQILLKINGAIPYSVLVDNQLKILAATTGLSSEEELIKMINTP